VIARVSCQSNVHSGVCARALASDVRLIGAHVVTAAIGKRCPTEISSVIGVLLITNARKWAVQTTPGDLSCQTVNGERPTRAQRCAVSWDKCVSAARECTAPNVSRAKGSGARAWPRGRLDINAITTVPMLTRPSSVAKETRGAS
jgi:hypothetical protein